MGIALVDHLAKPFRGSCMNHESRKLILFLEPLSVDTRTCLFETLHTPRYLTDIIFLSGGIP